MNTEEFIGIVQGKSNEAVLKLLFSGMSRERKIDPDFLDILIDELRSRQLSEVEKEKFTAILNFEDGEILKRKEIETDFSEEEIIRIVGADTLKEKEARNVSLKNISDQLSILAPIVLVFGIGASIFLLASKQFLFGVVTVVNSIIIFLLLRGFSELIYVFVDIEFNTRKK